MTKTRAERAAALEAWACPSPLARRIKDHIAFWHSVEIDRHSTPCRGA